jgi:cytochrome P450
MEELTKLFGADIVRREANLIDEATNHIEAGREFDLVDRNNVMLNLAMLLIAANVTTTQYLANEVWTFDEEDVIDDLHDGSIPLSDALEKVLRYRSPVMPEANRDRRLGDRGCSHRRRTARRWLAQRRESDPDVSRGPDEFRPGGDQEKAPIPFGKGIFYCPGAPLTNMKTKIFITKFRDCVDDWEVTAAEIAPFFSSEIEGPKPPDPRVDVSRALFALLIRAE